MTERALSGHGSRFAIATPHVAATEAGRAAFEAGGNAIDAALAAATTLAVVYPHMCGVGGDLFALVQRPEGDVVAVNSTGVSPRGIDPDAVRAAHGTVMPERGPFTVTVPGAVAGWWALHRRGAWLAWPDLFEAALAHAGGVPVARSLADHPRVGRRAGPRRRPGARCGLLPERRAARPRARTLVQPALGATLAALAADGPRRALRRRGRPPVRARPPRGRGPDRALGPRGHTRRRPCPRSSAATATSTFASPHPRPRASSCSRSSPPSSAWRSTPTRSGPTPATLALLFRAASLDRDRHLADPEHMTRAPAHAARRRPHRRALRRGPRSGGRCRSTPRPTPQGGTVGLATADADGLRGLPDPEPRAGVRRRGSWSPPPASSRRAAAAGSCSTRRTRTCSRPASSPRTRSCRSWRTARGGLAAVSATMGGSAHPQINTMSLDPRVRPRALPRRGRGRAPVAGRRDGPRRSRPVRRRRALGGRARARPLERAGFRVDVLEDPSEDVGHAHLIVVGPDGHLRRGHRPARRRRGRGRIAASIIA